MTACLRACARARATTGSAADSTASPGADRSPRPTQKRLPPAAARARAREPDQYLNPPCRGPCRLPLPERLPAPYPVPHFANLLNDTRARAPNTASSTRNALQCRGACEASGVKVSSTTASCRTKRRLRPLRLRPSCLGVRRACALCFTAAAPATPPSIAIEALVLGGPEVVRVVLNSSSTRLCALC